MDKWLEKFNNIEFLSLILKLTLILGLKIKIQRENGENERMNINWYPGHMKKTKDLIVENLKIIDVVIEILDARIPISSKNPDISKLANNKKKIIVLNKVDLIDSKELKSWEDYFLKNNYNAGFT